MLFPMDRVDCFVAEDATPPPPPWREREMMSQVMKMRVYHAGRMREIFSPYTMILATYYQYEICTGKCDMVEETYILARHRYNPAE